MRLILYGGDVPTGDPVDEAIRGWLHSLRHPDDDDGPGEPERPVWRLELLAEGRTAVDVIAGMPDWGSTSDVELFYRGHCRSDGWGLVLVRYTFNAVPPACALPYFHEHGEADQRRTVTRHVMMQSPCKNPAETENPQ